MSRAVFHASVVAVVVVIIKSGYTVYSIFINHIYANIDVSLKRNYEQKLACNIKNDSKSFYPYVRSKQNIQDKVGPLEDSAGNIILQGF